MPIYSVTSPDGRKLKITGDNPPSEQELDEIFKSVSQPVQQESKPLLNRAIDTAKSIIDIPSQISYGAQESMGMEPKDMPYPEPQTGLSGVGKMIGKGLGYVAPTPGAGALESQIAPAFGSAGKAILRTAPIQKAGSLIGKTTKPISKMIGDSVKFVSSQISSVPEFVLENAVKRESENPGFLGGVFGKKHDLDKMFLDVGKKIKSGIEYVSNKFDDPTKFDLSGKKMQEGLRYLQNKAGENVELARDIIRNSNKKVDLTPFSNKINDYIEKTTNDSISELNRRDLEEISRIKKMLSYKNDKKVKFDEFLRPIQKEESTINRLLSVRDQIDNIVDYKHPGDIGLTDKGEIILKDIRNQIKQKLEKEFPEIIEPNKKYSEIMDLTQHVKTSLKDKNRQQTAYDLFNNSEFMKSIFKAIDDKLPEGRKFFNDLQDMHYKKGIASDFSGITKSAETMKSYNTKNLFTKEKLDELNDLLPPEKQFKQELLDAVTHDTLSRLLPGQGGGSGSAQGFGNLVRSKFLTSSTKDSNIIERLAKIALAPIGSPSGTRNIIRAGVALPKQTKKLIKLSDAFVPGISRSVTGTDNQGGQ